MDGFVKWAMLLVAYAGLMVLSACAESGSFGNRFISAINLSPGDDSYQEVIIDEAPLIIRSTSTVMGKSPAELQDLMGEPGLLRQEIGAQVWQYTDRTCVLILYLYQDDAKVYRVTYAEARNKAPQQPRRCRIST